MATCTWYMNGSKVSWSANLGDEIFNFLVLKLTALLTYNAVISYEFDHFKIRKTSRGVCVCVCEGGGHITSVKKQPRGEAVRVDWDPWSLPLVLPLKTCSMIEARASLGRLLDMGNRLFCGHYLALIKTKHFACLSSQWKTWERVNTCKNKAFYSPGTQQGHCVTEVYWPSNMGTP